MRLMQIESVLQTKSSSELAKNRFSVALVRTEDAEDCVAKFTSLVRARN